MTGGGAIAEVLCEVKEMRADFGRRLGELEITTSLIKQSIGQISPTVENLEKILLLGNGDPPMRATVKSTKELLDQHIKEAKDKTAGKKGIWIKIMLLAIGMLISNIGLMISAYLKP